MTREIDSWLKKQSEEMLAFLKQIASIPSGTFSKSGVDQIGDLVSLKLRQLGFGVEKVRQSQYGDHLLARKPGKDLKTVLCIGHMDTVFEDEDYSKYPFRVDGAQVHGPGVLDMKGGIVVLLYGMEALRNVSPEVFDEIRITVFLNSDEEVHSPTSREPIEAQAKEADTACIFEPARPGGEYVTRRKGIGFYEVDVQGRSAHAGSQPELGASAIDELCHFVLEANRLRDSASGTTLNVGVFKGGTRGNVIAESAHAEIDVRSFEPARIAAVEKRLRELGKDPVNREAKIFIKGGTVQPPMVRTKATMELFALLQKSGKEIGVDLNETWTGGGSDGNFTAQYTPTIDGMGPQGSGSHNAEKEYIVLHTLVERSSIFARFLVEWLSNFKTTSREVQL